MMDLRVRKGFANGYLSPVSVAMCLLVGILLGSHPVNGKVVFDGQTASMSVEGSGIGISQIRPRVQLFPGDDKSLIDWRPDTSATISRKNEETPLGPALATTLTWKHPSGFMLDWIVCELSDRDAFTAQCRLTNNSDKELRIRRFFVLDATVGSMEIAGSAGDWMTASRYLKYAKYYDTLAELQRRGQITRDNSRSAKYTRSVPYDEDFTLYTDHGQRGLSISAVGDVSFIWTHLHVPQDGSLGLDVTSEMTGVLVEPGESRFSERILVSFESWRNAGLDVVKWLGSTFNPRGTKPVFGWCSWYCAGFSVRQYHCLNVADYVRTRRDRYPFETIQVDEGWQIGRHRWHPNKKFDKGMVYLAKAMEVTGAMPGVWLSPATPNSQRVVDGKVQHFDMSSNGSMVRSFDDSWYPGYRLGRPVSGNLDPSAPGAREYMIGELRRLYNQGYRYFKTDFSLVADVESGYQDPKKTRFQMQRLLYSVFREGIGEDGYLLACNGGPVRAVLGLADATRIGTDSGQKWAFCYRPNEHGKPDDVHGSWFPIVQTGCASFYTHLMACDPDVARVDNTGNAKYDPRFVGQNKKTVHYLPLESVRTWHSVVGLYGGTMMISDLIYEGDYQIDTRLRMVEIMQPVTLEKGWNFGGGTDILNTQFGFVAERPWGNFACMVAWNPDHKSPRDLKIDRVPLEKIGDEFHLWSFWDEKYLGVQDKSYVFKDVPRYHCRLIRLTPVREQNNAGPILVGSNLHLSMGSAEIKHVQSNSQRTTVELIPTAGAIEGQLVFFSKEPLKVKQTKGCQAFVMQNAPDVYTAVITERNRDSQQSITVEAAEQNPSTLEQVKSDTDLHQRWLAGTIRILK